MTKKKPLHIIFATLAKMYHNAGDTTHVLELARELSRCGARVTLVASGKPNEALAGVEVIDAGRVVQGGVIVRLFTFVLLSLLVLYHVLRLSRQADVLYTRDASLSFLFVPLSYIHRLPLVFEVNGFWSIEKKMFPPSLGGRLISLISRLAERNMARHARAFICVTEGIRNTLAQEYGAPFERMKVVHNGVNLELFSPDADTKEHADLRKSLDLRKDDGVILYLGTLLPWQDVPLLLEAAGELDMKTKRAVLLIVGEGSQREQLEEQARRLSQRVRVVFTGHVPYRQAPAYICLADVCALPRTREVNEKTGLSPIKLYAYLACGKPVVASRIDGLEFLEEAGLGTLVTCGDVDGFASALQNRLEDPRDRKALARRIRDYAESHCGWEKTAKSVFEVCLGAAHRNVSPRF